MLGAFSQMIRNAIHTPRRFAYAFLWAKVPPEDVPVGPATPKPVSPART